MISILHNYLNVVKILKLAKLTDEEYKNFYEFVLQNDNINKTLTNTPLNEEDKNSLDLKNLSISNLRDLFLLSQPFYPLAQLIAERDETLSKVSKSDEAIFDTTVIYHLGEFAGSKIPEIIFAKIVKYIEQNREDDALSGFSNELLVEMMNKHIIDETLKLLLLLGSDIETLSNMAIHYKILMSLIQQKNKFNDELKSTIQYQSDIDANPKLQNLKREEDRIANKLTNELINSYQINIMKREANVVQSGAQKRLNHAINIRLSDIFDFLKQIDFKENESDTFSTESLETSLSPEEITMGDEDFSDEFKSDINPYAETKVASIYKYFLETATILKNL